MRILTRNAIEPQDQHDIVLYITGGSN